MGIEFFCPDCPRAKAQEVCEMINFLVGRMKKGYPVGDGQTASSEGRDICLKLTLLNDAERAAAIQHYHLHVSDGAGLLLMQPAYPNLFGDPDGWGRVPPGVKMTLKKGMK